MFAVVVLPVVVVVLVVVVVKFVCCSPGDDILLFKTNKPDQSGPSSWSDDVASSEQVAFFVGYWRAADQGRQRGAPV